MAAFSKNCFRVVMWAALFAAFLSLPSARAADDEAGKDVGVLSVPSGLSIDGVKETLVSSAVLRRWEIKESTDGKIVCHYARGKSDTVLTMKYDTKEISFFCVGTSRKEMGWIANLKKDITLNLGRALALRK